MRKSIIFLSLLSLALLFSCAKQGKVLIPPDISKQASKDVWIDKKKADSKQFTAEVPQKKKDESPLAQKICRKEKFPICPKVTVDGKRVPDKDIACKKNTVIIQLEPLQSGIFINGADFVKTPKKKFSVFVNGKQVSYKDNLDGTLSFVLD